MISFTVVFPSGFWRLAACQRKPTPKEGRFHGSGTSGGALSGRGQTAIFAQFLHNFGDLFYFWAEMNRLRVWS
ncbi:MAG: hypothetical protein PF443_12685, partial [Allgaiera sp.]|nr:hypothetical protein [Allgaiera sp.]